MENASSSALRPAVFLDRDGTLNADLGYVCRPEDVRWLPGVAAALARLRWAGYLLIVVTNQSGIARGYYDVPSMQALHDWMDADLRSQGAHIDAFYHCPHHPDIDGACTCRKPAPGMLLRAADDWFIDLGRSWMIGDKMSDVTAGRAAGCTPILLSAGVGLPDEDPPLLRAASLGEAADLILSGRESGPSKS